MKRLLTIVEGEGDERAVPELIRRILHAEGRFDIELLRPHRRGDLPKVRANFQRFLEVACLENASVLCLLDFDCQDCVNALDEEEKFRSMARTFRPDCRFDACFIVKEFESMFLWDEVGTRRALPQIADLAFPADPEAIRDVKGWLSGAQPKGCAYKPTAHQAKVVSQLDLALLNQRSPSYQRLKAAVLQLTA